MTTLRVFSTVVVLFLVGAFAFFAWNQLTQKKETTPTSQFGEVLTPTPFVTKIPTTTFPAGQTGAQTKGGVKVVPQTGSNLWVIIFGSASLGLAGWYLVKKAEI